MALIGNFETAKAGRKAVTILTGDVFGRTEILAGDARENEGQPQGPHAFLVEQSPDVSLPSHFHLTNQFQVVLAGGGMLGRAHELSPGTVHYSRGKTAYGPIVAGSGGLSYLTVRPRIEYGAHYLSHPDTVVDRQAPKFQMTRHATPSGTPLNEVISPQADGLAAWLAELQAGESPALPRGNAHAGRFCVVMSGRVQVNADLLPPWSCIWLDAGEDASQLRAGPEGAMLLALQFPLGSDLPATTSVAIPLATTTDSK